MNTSDTTPPTPHGVPTDRRPLGYWLRVVDGLLATAFADAFHAEGVDRRDWMLLNLLSGDVDRPAFTSKPARHGKRLRALADRGWVVETDGEWTLTDAGRDARARLGALVDGIRTRVSVAVPPEDFATTMASLEAIARELGWNESDRDGRESGWRRRFGRRVGPGHRCDRRHDGHHRSERAYERGFAAGVDAAARIAGNPA